MYFESANGTSRIAREANNYFGIKCGMGRDKKGKPLCRHSPRCREFPDETKHELFRVYHSKRDSYEDHKEFLMRPRYAWIWEKYPNPDAFYTISWDQIPEEYRAYDYPTWVASNKKIKRTKRVWLDMQQTKYLKFGHEITVKGDIAHFISLSAVGYGSDRRYAPKLINTYKNLKK